MKLTESEQETVDEVRRRVTGNLIGDRAARQACGSLLDIVDRLTGAKGPQPTEAAAVSKGSKKKKGSVRVQEGPDAAGSPSPSDDDASES